MKNIAESVSCDMVEAAVSMTRDQYLFCRVLLLVYSYLFCGVLLLVYSFRRRSLSPTVFHFFVFPIVKE